LEGGLAYARLILFQRGAAGELERALARLSSERPLSGLILDLRDNPGGLLDEAVSVADLFLDDGVIVSTWGRLESERAEHRATPGGVPAALPVVTLINGYSASASEIVAAALQETGRATLVGTRTYGKGSVQTMYEHLDGSALKLTIGRYYTPSGNPVAPEDGRAPDLVVAWPVATTTRSKLKARLTEVGLSAAERDELTALVDALPDDPPRGRPAIPFDLPLAERPSRDPQLAAALLMLRAKAE
jgi:carboxyl-terminal processing protease